MKFGYARTSTKEQNPERQLHRLKGNGAEKIFQDIESGSKRKRTELDRMLGQLREGDQVIVLTLDRLSRSLRDLLEIVEQIEQSGADLMAINENIDTSSPSGKLMFHIFGVIAEFERDRIRERVREGIASARAKGRVGGRPPALTEEQKRAVVSFCFVQKKSIAECARVFGVSRRTISRTLADATGHNCDCEALDPTKC